MISQKADWNKAEKWNEFDLVKKGMKGLPDEGNHMKTASTRTTN